MGNIKLFGMPLKEFSDTLMEAARLEKLRLVLVRVDVYCVLLSFLPCALDTMNDLPRYCGG
jgi:hypothetical protein